MAEIAIGQFHQRGVQELGCLAPVREGILVAAQSLKLAGVGVEETRLAEQVECNIGHRDVFFDDRPMAAPLRQALREDQRAIRDPQQIGQVVRAQQHRFANRIHLVAIRYRWFTSSGS